MTLRTVRFFQPDYTIAVVLIGDNTNGGSPVVRLADASMDSVSRVGKIKRKVALLYARQMRVSCGNLCSYPIFDAQYVDLDLQPCTNSAVFLELFNNNFLMQKPWATKQTRG